MPNRTAFRTVLVGLGLTTGVVGLAGFCSGCSDHPEQLGEIPALSPVQPEAAQTARDDGTPPTTAPEPTPVARVESLEGTHLRILGTAQDGGLPHAACDCERCAAARTDETRARSVASVALVSADGARSYLVDATPDIHEQLHRLRDVGDPNPGRVDRKPIDGLLLTHAHIGHYIGMALLGFEAVHTDKLPVWASPKMTEFLTKNAPWEQLIKIGNIEPHPLSIGERIELEPGLAVTPLTVPHRDEYSDTLGFVFEGARTKILYVPDTAPWKNWPTPLLTVLAEHQIDIALLDGTFYSGDELPGRDLSTLAHPLIVDSMDLLQPVVDGGKTRVIFTHLNHSNAALDPSGPESKEIEKRGFSVADDSLQLAL